MSARNLFGGAIAVDPGHVLRRTVSRRAAQLMFSYERYFNSNNYSANILETGLQFAF